MEIINDLDLQGRLQIVQNPDINKYSMDSILLASFVKLNKKDEKIVDLCAGNCPIGLLLTLKKTNLKITCIELQKESYKLGVKSININKLDESVKVINDNLINISQKIGANKYDIITCNPPYFRFEESANIKQNVNLSISRHEIEVKLNDIILESKKLLRTHGKLYLVHRPERIDEIIHLLLSQGFEVSAIRFVYPYVASKEANVVLIEAKKNKSKDNKVKVLRPLYVYKKINEYTEEMLKIMNMEEN